MVVEYSLFGQRVGRVHSCLSSQDAPEGEEGDNEGECDTEVQNTDHRSCETGEESDSDLGLEDSVPGDTTHGAKGPADAVHAAFDTKAQNTTQKAAQTKANSVKEGPVG